MQTAKHKNNVFGKS